MATQRVAERVRNLIEPVITSMAYELVDVQYVKEARRYILRIFIDRQGGVGLDDCEQVSRAVEPLLDASDPVPEHYYLEVSSPGIDRPLKKAADYERFAGRKVLLKTYAPVDGRRTFRGVLGGLAGDHVVLQADGQEISLPLAGVAQARLDE
ncbi:MAG: ribosome maturation factor RimP [Clostridia bacterium]|nr:MAG: ribosome maturation factor RimP [Clostridia bacterium]